MTSSPNASMMGAALTCSDGDSGASGGRSSSSLDLTDCFVALTTLSSCSCSKNAAASASSSGGTRRPAATAGTSSLLIPAALTSSSRKVFDLVISIGFGRGGSFGALLATLIDRSMSFSSCSTAFPPVKSRIASACFERIGTSSNENVARADGAAATGDPRGGNTRTSSVT